MVMGIRPKYVCENTLYKSISVIENVKSHNLLLVVRERFGEPPTVSSIDVVLIRSGTSHALLAAVA